MTRQSNPNKISKYKVYRFHLFGSVICVVFLVLGCGVPKAESDRQVKAAADAAASEARIQSSEEIAKIRAATRQSTLNLQAQLAQKDANQKAFHEEQLRELKKLREMEEARHREMEKAKAFQEAMEKAEGIFTAKLKEETAKLNSAHDLEIKKLSREFEDSEKKAVERASELTETRVRVQMWGEKNQDVLLISLVVGFGTIIVSALAGTTVFNIQHRKYKEAEEAKFEKQAGVIRRQSSDEIIRLEKENKELRHNIDNYHGRFFRDRQFKQLAQVAVLLSKQGHDMTGVITGLAKGTELLEEKG